VSDEGLMDDFFETVTYEGDVRPWEEVPEIGTSEDEPNDDEVVKTLARRAETAIHKAADAHVADIARLFDEAFAVGVKKINRVALERTHSPTVVMQLMESVIEATEKKLLESLEDELLACLSDGGNAALDEGGFSSND